MMKTILLPFFLLIFLSGFGQKTLKSSYGFVQFKSSTEKESFESGNFLVSASFNKKTHVVRVEVPMTKFAFQRKLMQLQFNERYLETEKFPKAYFEGSLMNYQSGVEFDTLIIKGSMTIHGVKKPFEEKIIIHQNRRQMNVKSKFFIKPKDYNITIPKQLKEKIAEKIEVNVEFKLN